MFSHPAQFPSQMVRSLVPTLLKPLAVPIIVSWLLLVATDQVPMEDQGVVALVLSKRLEMGLRILEEQELLACHAGLEKLDPGSGAHVRSVLESVHGYRL